MKRLKLSFPESNFYQESFPIRVDDLNYGNHLGNERLLVFAHNVRVNFFRSIDQSERSFFHYALLQTAAQVQYIREVHLGDVLTAKMAIALLSATSFKLFYEFTNQGQKLIGRVHIEMVAFDQSTQKVTALHQSFHQWLDGL